MHLRVPRELRRDVRGGLGHQRVRLRGQQHAAADHLASHACAIDALAAHADGVDVPGMLPRQAGRPSYGARADGREFHDPRG